MKLPLHKTKIVCTIGPACCSPSKLEGMIKSGMNVARLNFSHGEFEEHAQNIRNIRAAALKSGRPVGILHRPSRRQNACRPSSNGSVS